MDNNQNTSSKDNKREMIEWMGRFQVLQSQQTTLYLQNIALISVLI
jgi:hypothetical protein